MKRNLRDSYKFYKQEATLPINSKDYLEIVAGFNKFMIDKVLEGDEVVLPVRFGTLSIIGRKQEIKYDQDGKIIGLAPNWKKTKELWDRNEDAKKRKQLVYCTNEHTSNIRYRFFWSKNKVFVTNKTLYALRMTRTNKRTVNVNVTTENKEYTRI